MIVLYIILGIICGVPAYLLLNTLLVLLARPFAALAVYLLGPKIINSSFMNEIKGGDGSLAVSIKKADKIIGFFLLVVALFLLIVTLIGRLFWLVYQVFRAWFEFVKFCWNLGSKTKKEIKTKE